MASIQTPSAKRAQVRIDAVSAAAPDVGTCDPAPDTRKVVASAVVNVFIRKEVESHAAENCSSWGSSVASGGTPPNTDVREFT